MLTCALRCHGVVLNGLPDVLHAHLAAPGVGEQFFLEVLCGLLILRLDKL